MQSNSINIKTNVNLLYKDISKLSLNFESLNIQTFRTSTAKENGGFQCRHFRTRRVLQMRTSALFGAKNSRFFEIYGASARTRRGGRGGKPV